MKRIRIIAVFLAALMILTIPALAAGADCVNRESLCRTVESRCGYSWLIELLYSLGFCRAEDIPEEIPEETPEEAPEEIPEETPEATPDTTPEQESEETPQISVPQGASQLTVGGKTVYIGEDAETVISTFGQPDRTDKGVMGLDWYIYNSDYSELVMIGLAEGKVAGFYTAAGSFDYSGACREYTDGDGVYAVLCARSGSSYETNLQAYADQIFDITNAYRVANGLKPLSRDGYADSAAEYHSEDMAQRNYFSHQSPEGVSAGGRYQKFAGRSASGWGENIAAGQSSAFEAMDAWINSAGHRANILNGGFSALGTGCAYDASSTYKIYSTQVFVG